MNETLLDVLDAANVLNMSTRHVLDLVRKGQLVHVAFPNGAIRFNADDLRRFIDSHKLPAAGGGGR